MFLQVLLTEAYTSLNNTLKYYNYGSNVPFNFKFITDANSSSTPEQFKAIIDNWVKGISQNDVPNWVVRKFFRNYLNLIREKNKHIYIYILHFPDCDSFFS